MPSIQTSQKRPRRAALAQVPRPRPLGNPTDYLYRSPDTDTDHVVRHSADGKETLPSRAIERAHKVMQFYYNRCGIGNVARMVTYIRNLRQPPHRIYHLAELLATLELRFAKLEECSVETFVSVRNVCGFAAFRVLLETAPPRSHSDVHDLYGLLPRFVRFLEDHEREHIARVYGDYTADIIAGRPFEPRDFLPKPVTH